MIQLIEANRDIFKTIKEEVQMEVNRLQELLSTNLASLDTPIFFGEYLNKLVEKRILSPNTWTLKEAETWERVIALKGGLVLRTEVVGYSSPRGYLWQHPNHNTINPFYLPRIPGSSHWTIQAPMVVYPISSKDSSCWKERTLAICIPSSSYTSSFDILSLSKGPYYDIKEEKLVVSYEMIDNIKDHRNVFL